MLPIGDDNTHRTSFPFVTISLIVMNIIMFAMQVSYGDDFTYAYSVIPLDITDGGSFPFVTLFSAMFMHGSLGHIAGNMLYLYVFGDNVEDDLGHGRYLLFYLLTGLAATFAQVYSNPMSQIPNLGASGAISGVLGAYLILHTRNRVKVWMFWFVFWVPAYFVLGLYALTQILSASASFYDTASGGGVAYMAHVGGFIAGVILVFVFRRPRATAHPLSGFTTTPSSETLRRW
jgi:membrane associated rhomboid family serine protease